MSAMTITFGILFIGSIIGIKIVDCYEKEFDELDKEAEKEENEATDNETENNTEKDEDNKA